MIGKNCNINDFRRGISKIRHNTIELDCKHFLPNQNFIIFHKLLRHRILSFLFHLQHKLLMPPSISQSDFKMYMVQKIWLVCAIDLRNLIWGRHLQIMKASGKSVSHQLYSLLIHVVHLWFDV